MKISNRAPAAHDRIQRRGRRVLCLWPLALGCVAAAASRAQAAGAEAAAPAVSTCSLWGDARLVARIAHPQLVESSGLVASRRYPGLFYTHNDSGNLPLLFALRADGSVPALYRCRGAENDDWEDIALGPGPSGEGWALYIGDVGSSRNDPGLLSIYVLPEPELPAAPPAEPILLPASRFDLTYPDGPHDCEALAVHPTTGVLYLMTKPQAATPPIVYRCAPPFIAGARRQLDKVGTVPLARDPLVTGMDIHPAGARLVVRTYYRAYEFVAAAPALFEERLGFDPRPIRITPMGQSEAICYGADGDSLFLTAEASPMPLYEVPCAASTDPGARGTR